MPEKVLLLPAASVNARVALSVIVAPDDTTSLSATPLVMLWLPPTSTVPEVKPPWTISTVPEPTVVPNALPPVATVSWSNEPLRTVPVVTPPE